MPPSGADLVGDMVRPNAVTVAGVGSWGERISIGHWNGYPAPNIAWDIVLVVLDTTVWHLSST